MLQLSSSQFVAASSGMFDHPDFEKYLPEELPLNCDVYLRDEIYIEPYELAFEIVRQGGAWKNPGYVMSVAVRQITPSNIELSWYANVGDRFHEVMIALPRDKEPRQRSCLRVCRKCEEF